MKINNLLAVLFILLITGVISSCGGEEQNFACPSSPNLSGVDEAQLKADTTAIEAYLDNKGIQASVHPSGLRYVIVEEGDGQSPGLCQNVIITYSGQLMSNEEIFDRSPTGEVVVFTLRNLILGWQLGLPLIKEGGKIILYVPSQLAYGDQPAGSIPANSNLIFTIELKGIQ